MIDTDTTPVHMKQTIKNAIATTAATVSYLSLTAAAYAQTELNPCEGGGTSSNIKTNLCALQGQDAGVFIRNLIVAILVIAAVIALFFLVWGGVKWILSGGDKGKVEAARSTIIAAILGLIITFMAYFILNIVLGLFGLNLSDLTLPKLNTPA
jgi:hypothetical protein